MSPLASLLPASLSNNRSAHRRPPSTAEEHIDHLCATASDLINRDSKAALDAALHGLALSKSGMGSRREAELHCLVGRALVLTEESVRAIGHLVAGTEMARSAGQLEIEYECLVNLALALLINDDLDGAVRELEIALKLAQSLSDAVRMRRAQDRLLKARRLIGESNEVQLPLWSESAESPHHTVESLVSALNNLGRCYVDAGRPAEAVAALTRAAHHSCSEEVSPAAWFVVRGNLAVALAANGQGEEALAQLQAAQHRARTLAFLREERQLLAREGEVLRELGRNAESVVCLTQALEAAEGAGQVGEQREAYADLMLSLKALGDFEAALRASENLRRIDEQLSRERAQRRLSALAHRFELDKARREAELQAAHNTELKTANAQLRVANTSLKKALQALGFDARRPRPPGTPGDAALTARERQVLSLLGKGRSNRAIGEALGLSPITVRHHVSAIMGKLGASSRTEAVAIALRGGTL